MIYKIKLFIKLLFNNPHFAPLIFKPRYKAFTIKLFGKKIHVPDSASFIYMWQEIFVREIYKFQTTKPNPVIIDGGANIGMSIIFCKQLYPKAHIIAFEPDDNIFRILQKNIQEFGFEDVELCQKALWVETTTLQFESDGSDGGKVNINKNQNTNTVQATSLDRYLNQEIDFLKLDIEGAETLVLESCKDLLTHVKNIFIEYHSFDAEPQTLHQILEILRTNGFRYYVENNGVTSQQPLQNIRTEADMDLQLNIFGYRTN